MRRHVGKSYGASILFGLSGCFWAAVGQAQSPTESTALPEVTVTGSREAQPKAETPTTIDRIGAAEIDTTRAGHPSEIMNRIPGVHVNVTNGEGHMTAIRQPMTTGSVYLYLEDGVPTRSTGFFNHNALYEINLPQAGGIEVLKGPGSALHGSDAIGGVINVLTRDPSPTPEGRVALEYGAYGWMRGLASASNTWGDHGLRADLNLTHTDGWRDFTQYDRESATLRHDAVLGGDATLKTVFALSKIDQQTAGNSRVSYNDWIARPKTNYHPVSFRKVEAVRLSAAYEREDANRLLSLTPYARWNSMEMIPNWTLSYDPTVYTTSNASLGLLAKHRWDFAPMRTRLILGADLDYSPGNRDETTIAASRSGSIYTAYSKREKAYEYDVTYMAASPYVNLETSPIADLRLSGGVRLDAIRYTYDNKLSDSVVAGGGATTHNRFADNTVNYVHPSPKLGATYAFTPTFNGFASYKHAFRAPSESDLFRSGRAADSLHLQPVKANSYEVGVRGNPGKDFGYELSAYHMVKKDDILTYTSGNTRTVMNAGETQHRGVEAGANYRLSEEWKSSLSLSYAKHTYERWIPQTGSTLAGKEMENAPRFMGGATVTYTPSFLPGGRIEGEWTGMGEYWLDSANTPGHRYTGHNLFNLRAGYELTPNIALSARLLNVFDSRWATIATYSTTAGDEFAPGLPRTAYVGIEAKF